MGPCTGSQTGTLQGAAPAIVRSFGDPTHRRTFDLRPKLLIGEIQAYYHTLNPLLDDETQLEQAATTVPFSNRVSFSLHVGYESALSLLRIQYGLGLGFLNSELRYGISNAPDNSQQSIRNLRVNLSLWTSAIADLRRWHLPGYFEGILALKHELWQSDLEASAYGASVVRYGLFIGDQTNIYLGYGSFVRAEHIPGLGTLRPHIYALGFKQYLR